MIKSYKKSRGTSLRCLHSVGTIFELRGKPFMFLSTSFCPKISSLVYFPAIFRTVLMYNTFKITQRHNLAKQLGHADRVFTRTVFTSLDMYFLVSEKFRCKRVDTTFLNLIKSVGIYVKLK